MGAANPYHGSISFLQVLSSGLTEVLKIFDLRTICCLNLGWEEEGRMQGLPSKEASAVGGKAVSGESSWRWVGRGMAGTQTEHYRSL